MNITKTLQPGDMGTKRLLEQYGEQLVCVRYRVNRLAEKRFTTVELIIDEKDYVSLKPTVKVWVKINFNETDIRQQAKASGAKWLTKEKAWEMDYETAQKLRLKKRIINRIVNSNI